MYKKFKNLNSLLAWGHATVIDHLTAKTGCKKALIDKFASESLISSMVLRKNKDIELQVRTHAEDDVLVAAAAILARSTFLNALKDMGDSLGLELPKGASSKTKDAAKNLINKHGIETLETVCKKHFQTYQQVIDGC